jgi:membrane protein DedA with SNARE-associated domain
MMIDFFNFFLNITQDLGYWGIIVLMTIESSFIPMPSEIIIPPAAYLSSLGKMNIFLIIIAGIIGSVLGAIFNYSLGYYLGRPIIYKLSNHRFSRFLLINPEKLIKAEKYFLDNSITATFFGRLIPVIRQLISLPAGFCKMPFLKFIFYTTLGSAIWVIILAGLGYFIGYNKELLILYYREIIWILIFIIIIWIFRKKILINFKLFFIKNFSNK